MNPAPRPRRRGTHTRHEPLRRRRRLATGGHGPEDVIFDGQGGLLTGPGDGSIVRIDPVTGARAVTGSTGGCPLGLQPAADDSILISDHHRGLLRMSAGGSVEVLVDTVAGRLLTFAGNVVEGPDGTI
ncbi:hypothetical protein [Streptomyces sp. GbtcB6]|uniref:hypothetical protein n=1 Tax=Streptomyces sp. GbtcB6 TaxID=2824751 RepID=UPI0020C6B053|nr:hypothetical protein [Streptomyces sp. GbtcB6]